VRNSRAVLLAAVAWAGAASPVFAQHDHESDVPVGFDKPIPLYSVGLGPYARRVTTTSSEAQAFVNQGLQLQFAFAPRDAARSFREAQRRDPSCAMCYWGEAYAWGPYLNGEMRAEDAPRAYRAIQRARELAKGNGTAVEHALIDAMAVRYEEKHDAARREKLDSLYADTMAAVHARFPDDLDAATLYAEALMLLEPRRGTWDVNKPAVRTIHQALEHVLARDLKHPGACHLYVHATESTVRPEKAEACADHLGSAIPGASHINHMPSHTYNRVGRWGDAVRANLQAWHSDQKAAVGLGFAIYPTHNLHMLMFAASFDGQGAVAMQAGKDYAKQSTGGQALQVLALLRFGRFDEILTIRSAPEQAALRGFWAFGRGYAHLRGGAADSARAYLAVVDSLAGVESAAFRGHAARRLLGSVGGILRGEIARDAKRLEDAIAALERAVELEDELIYDEPEPLNFSARHWLGAALLEAGRHADAERVYRRELEDHPNNGWSLFGLAQALEAQGKKDDAPRVHASLEQAWARSDTWINASRF
jgi:tetratricopeptide (TPR) repeat protein